MKRYLSFLALLAGSIVVLGDFCWAQCPENQIDLGFCDTLHVVAWDATECDSFPCLVHVPLLVTHDSNTFWWDPPGKWVQDSISGFVIPFIWTHTNPSAYCSLSIEKNTHHYGDTENGIFRHFGGMHNRMRDLYEMGEELTWVITLCLDYLFFSLNLVPATPEARRWWEGNRVLLATLTFTVSDTMTICVDEHYYHIIWFTRMDAVNYCPQKNMPMCMTVRIFERGDANGDGVIDSADIVYLINHLFADGPPPPAVRAGDVNCDGVIDSADVIYLINYLFADGPEPSC